MLKVTDYAKIINIYCREGQLFWAYELLKETLPMWEGENKRWLNNWAQAILENVKAAKAEREAKEGTT